jgi:uncharacterized protein
MNDLCLFVSDLHGKIDRYEKFFDYIDRQNPGFVFLGGDLLPSSILHSFRAGENIPDFINDYMAVKFGELQNTMRENFPQVFLILGNDDPRIVEKGLKKHEANGLWNYIHGKIETKADIKIMGYSYVPPTPFLLKDWEKYDVSISVKPGCLHPKDGFVTFNNHETEPETIQSDLEILANGVDLTNAICVFHSPPYNCKLDKAALDGVTVDGNPVDPHVGSTAIMEFIKSEKPMVTLHGHIHESSRLTGDWKDNINGTFSLSAAWEGPGLAVVRFRFNHPELAERIIIE